MAFNPLNKLGPLNPMPLLDPREAANQAKGFVQGLNRADNAESGPYGGIDQANFQLPGAEQREAQYQELIRGLQAQRAPQASNDIYTAQRQQRLLDMLNTQAQGGGPSLANTAARQASERAVANQQALLASGRGNQAGAARAAAQQAGAAQGSIAGNAAQARVQEQLGAQSALANALNAYRGQNQQIALANQRAQMQNQQLQQQGVQGLLAQSLQQAQTQQQGGSDFERNRTQRFGSLLGTPTAEEQVLGALTGAAGAIF